MQTWRSILREQSYSNEFELTENNDPYIVSSFISSYNKRVTASDEQVKEILDGAYKAGFKFSKRRYSTKVIYVLSKPYKNANMVIQLSIQPNTILVCEVAYGFSNEELEMNIKKSKYFPAVYNNFDKRLPLDFMNVDVKDKLTDVTHISISDEYDWADYFDYIYSFMIVMLTKLNSEESEVYLEESIQDDIETKNIETDLDIFSKELKNISQNIVIKHRMTNSELIVFVEWVDGYKDQQEENKNQVNIIINNFTNSQIEKGASVEIDRIRTNLYLSRTIFIKY